MDEIIIDTEKMEGIIKEVELLDYTQKIQQMCESLESVQNRIIESFNPENILQSFFYSLDEISKRFEVQMLSNVESILYSVNSAINKISSPILNIYNSNIPDDEKEEIDETNKKLITEIFQQDTEKKIDINESPVIVLSPVNEQVLKYLSENPKELYNLTDADFEIVMAEIYAKLGYDVTRTQSTRDGGKDIIIRKPEILGDFVYYVECKKYAPKRHIGVGIIRNLVGTVTTDRVNGGILATTSFFTKPARDFILENKWSCQIKMHDYNTIRALLNKAVDIRK